LNPALLHWEPLLAHSHWFSIRAFGRELRLCARCSGVVVGFLSSKSLWTMLSTPSSSMAIPFQTGFIMALLFAFPAIIDWTTQNVGLRESTNPVRLGTGLLEGLGILFLSVTDTSALTRLLLVSAISVGVVVSSVVMRRLLRQKRDQASNYVN
jgi:uncharacterized membrane protein